MKNVALGILVALFLLLHQDCWNWKSADPILFGFLPVGLWYHAAYSLGAAIVMALLVRFAWPAHLEALEEATTGHAGPAAGAAKK